MKLVCTTTDRVAMTPEVIKLYQSASCAAARIVEAVNEKCPAHVQVLSEFRCVVDKYNLVGHDWEIGASFILSVNVAGEEVRHTKDCTQIGDGVVQPESVDIADAFISRDLLGDHEAVPYELSVVGTLIRRAIERHQVTVEQVDELCGQLQQGGILEVEA